MPPRHIPAVVVGLVPALGAYTEFAIKRTLLAVGYGSPDHPIPAALNALFAGRADYYSGGVFAIGEGYIYTCMILSAATVHIIDRRFKVAAAWFAIGGVIAILGLAHNYRITGSDIIGVIGPMRPGANPAGLFHHGCDLPPDGPPRGEGIRPAAGWTLSPSPAQVTCVGRLGPPAGDGRRVCGLVAKGVRRILLRWRRRPEKRAGPLSSP